MTRATLLLIPFFFGIGAARAEDWPTWRGGQRRLGASQQKLPDQMYLEWELRLATPRPAWPPEQGKIQFDAGYEPIVVGQRMFIGSMTTDSVSAYNTRTGERIWRFHAEAPVRFAPAVWRDSVLAASDDGKLYCLDAETGSLRWCFQGGPTNRRLIGNDRLVSTWPARGGPVIVDGKVYFAAGIWPFMGVFLHALDVETGQRLWTNSGTGSNYLVQQHNSPAFAGVAPQGYLAANERLILVSGGRTTPACFDRKTGRFLYYRPGDRTLGKSAGGYGLMLGETWFINHGGVYDLASGKPLARTRVALSSTRGPLDFFKGVARVLAPKPREVVEEKPDKLGVIRKTTKWVWDERGKVALSGAKRLLLQAGDHLFAEGGEGELLAFRFDLRDATKRKAVWRAQLDSAIWNVVAADDRLFVSTRGGVVYCFAANRTSPVKRTEPRSPTRPTDGASPSYAVVYRYNAESVRLLGKENRHVIVIEPNVEAAARARREMDDAGWLGRRVAIVGAGAKDRRQRLEIAPYLANLIHCHTSEDARLVLRGELAPALSFNLLRPYGGVLRFPCAPAERVGFERLVKEMDRGGEARFTWREGTGLITRPSALPGAAPWTHHNGDIANTLISRDTRVKAPLGLLWFGGPSNKDVLPRHGHGPTPQVLGGRLFIEGPDMMRALDVYTGRLLWQRDLPQVGLYYNNTGHHPGAGAIGGNYVTMPDGVYLAYGRKCLKLDPATGKTLREFELPEHNGKRPYWGFIGIDGDLLIAGAEPTTPFATSKWKSEDEPRFAEGSRRLVALDRQSGKVRWSRSARFNFRHNAIVAGDGKVFCIDKMTAHRLEKLQRRGLSPSGPPVLYALDAKTGEVAWQTDEGVFGTWLGYSEDHGVLLEAGSLNRDRAKDDTAERMAVYRGATGEPVWRNDEIKYGGPCLLLGRKIISQGVAHDLLTGRPVMRKQSLTDGESIWRYSRNYGCNTAIGCPNLLTFRSAAAGYFDLAGDGGTGNLGGFRSSCTSNLIPADGVLSAPDYTRTCQCSYQNQCSLAFIHMPEAEMWTFRRETWDGAPIRRLGLNFGAPGDRRDAEGLLWLDYPSVGGTSPDVPVKIEGAPKYVRGHASQIEGEGPAWVHASGVSGVTRLRLTLDKKSKAEKRYTVRIFLRPRGDGVFESITLQDQPLARLPRPHAEPHRGVMLEARGVIVRGELTLTLDAKGERSPLLTGLQVVREDGSPAGR